MFNQLLLLAGGFILLAYGAEYLVKGSVSLAQRLGVSTLVIGLTVVAFGTSTPELAVNLLSAARGSTALALGNIFGSSIANILLILGLTAIVNPIVVQKETVWKQIPVSLLAALVVIVLGSDVLLAGQPTDFLSREDGFILLAFAAGFLFYMFRTRSRGAAIMGLFTALPFRRSWTYILGGLIGLGLGGKFIVDAATELAKGFGLSERLIGLTVVAVGTSLPELATCLAAARRKQADIAIGNVVGSNILNVFLVLGLTAVIAPIPFSADALRDGLVAAGASLLLFISMFIGKRHRLDRWLGVVFVAAYVAFTALSIAGG